MDILLYGTTGSHVGHLIFFKAVNIGVHQKHIHKHFEI